MRGLGLLILCVAFCSAAKLPVYFSNGCSGANEVGTVGSPAPQSCALVAGEIDDVTNTFSGTFKWDIGTDTVTQGHIHVGATSTASTGVKFVLWNTPSTGNSRTVTDFALNATAIAGMKAGTSTVYFNLHSTAFGSGATRGQMSTTAPSYKVFFYNGCTGGEEFPTTTGAASPAYCGETALTLNKATNTLTGTVNWDLPGDTMNAGHIHFGAKAGAATGNKFVMFSTTETSPYTVNIVLNDTAVWNIELGSAYLNLHSVAQPAGALRAQLYSGNNVPTRNWVPVYFSNGCNGLNEMNPGVPGAIGKTCTMSYGRVDDADNHFSADFVTGSPAFTDVTDIHLHYGADAATNAGTKIILWNGTATTGPFNFNGVKVSAQVITDLKAENSYINIHTTAFPSGAVRGQITTQKTNFVVVPFVACPTIEVCDFESTAVFDAIQSIAADTVTVFRVENPAGWTHVKGTSTAGYFRFIVNSVAEPTTGEPDNLLSWKVYDGPVVTPICTDDFTCKADTLLNVCNIAGRFGIDSSNFCIQDEEGPWHVVVKNDNLDKTPIDAQFEFELYNNALTCAVVSLDCTIGVPSAASTLGLGAITLVLSTMIAVLFF